ncbi:MAG: hypothetical protein KME38_22020 [Spirirestis rafaelensis WJT71-NPBG6]|nr:hypothetical protein [Spirirestis rafaelensis WJT71-NPBG6]
MRTVLLITPLAFGEEALRSQGPLHVMALRWNTFCLHLYRGRIANTGQGESYAR